VLAFALAGVLGAAAPACSRKGSEPEAAASPTPAPAAPLAVAEGPEKASGESPGGKASRSFGIERGPLDAAQTSEGSVGDRLVVVYVNNVDGEIEPCG
jgi:hypothetical protein